MSTDISLSTNHETTKANGMKTIADFDMTSMVETSAAITMSQVGIMARGQEQTLKVIEILANEGFDEADRRVERVVLARYKSKLKEMLADVQALLSSDTPPDLADFILAKRDLARAKASVKGHLLAADPDFEEELINEFFAEVDEILNAKRPADLLGDDDTVRVPAHVRRRPGKVS